MALVREATQVYPGNRTGEMKIAHYAISYAAGAIVKPTNDPLWMLLNGAAVSRTTYPLLFGLFGTTYGAGDGSTTFNLPDLTEGGTPIGKGLSSFTSLGASGGEINHTLVTSEIPAHTHGITGLSFVASPHAHTVTGSLNLFADVHTHSLPNTAIGGTTSFGIVTSTGKADGGTANNPATGLGGGHQHAITFTVGTATSYAVTLNGGISNNTGAGGAHNNMQPYIVVGGWLVKFG